MKAPRIQKDTSQGSKETLLSRNKTEGVVPTSTWALTNKGSVYCAFPPCQSLQRVSLWEAVSCWEGAGEDLGTSAGERGGNSALPSWRVE